MRYDPEPHIFFDHGNNFAPENHGLPCQDREWTLDDREKSGRDGGEKLLPVRQCSECFYCFKPAPVCPNCGFIFPIISREVEQIDGELAEIQIQEAKKEKRMEKGRAKTIAELQAIAKERGYDPKWVYIQAKIKGIKQ